MMNWKNISLILLVISCMLRPLSAQFFNEFSGNDLSEWQGDSNDFIEESGQLRLNAAMEGNSAIFHPSFSGDSIEYRFQTTLEFSPSNSNHLIVILATEDLDNPLETAYFLRVGENGGDDAFELIRSESGSEEILYRFPDGTMGNDPAYGNITIRHFANNTWEIIASHDESTPPTPIETIHESMPGLAFTAPYFGINCEYTSSRSEAFAFDNIGVQKIVPDREGPELLTMNVIDENTLELTYDEAVSEFTAENIANYRINSSTDGINAVSLNEVNKCIISLDDPLQSGLQNTLEISAVEDLAGNSMRDTSVEFTHYITVQALPYEILISEVMPSPAGGSLPDAEYVEIYNASPDKYFDLGELSFWDKSSVGSPSEGILKPGEFAILCEQGKGREFEEYGQVYELSQWPSLNNSGDSIGISHSSVTTHSIEYSSAWYSDNSLAGAGYSLELHNPDFPCFKGSYYWFEHGSSMRASPGRQNVPWDTVIEHSIQLINTSVPDANSLLLEFNTQLAEANIVDLTVQNASLNIAEFQIAGSSLVLSFEEEMQSGELYAIDISMLEDCKAELLYEGEGIKFALPEKYFKSALCINEIMFDPESGEPQWIELYNGGGKVHNLGDLVLSIYKESINFEISLKEELLILPEDYLLLSRDREKLIQTMQVDASKVVSEPDMATLSREMGAVLLRGDGVLIDSVLYHEDWHDPLLSETKGVSIARIVCGSKGGDEHNWYSSSAISGFSTPGRENEITKTPAPSTDEDFELLTPSFSPDGDGYEDIMLLRNNLDWTEQHLSMEVYDLNGRLIKTILNNKTASFGDIYTWTGDTNSVREALPGMYVIIIQVFTGDGSRKIWKTSCSLYRP